MLRSSSDLLACRLPLCDCFTDVRAYDIPGEDMMPCSKKTVEMAEGVR